MAGAKKNIRRRFIVLTLTLVTLVALVTKPAYIDHELPLIRRLWLDLKDEDLSRVDAPRPETDVKSVREFLQYWIDRRQPYGWSYFRYLDFGVLSLTYGPDPMSEKEVRTVIFTVGAFGRVWIRHWVHRR